MLVCRSGRLTGKTKASNPTVQAQNVLKQKLRIANMALSPDPTALEGFKAFFVAPLLPSKQEAFRRSSLQISIRWAWSQTLAWSMMLFSR
jgi:hypothetical protein